MDFDVQKDCYAKYESNARSYCRNFDAVFDTAVDSHIFSSSGMRYIDFLSGAGALNYGHNNRIIKKAIIKYVEQDGLTMSLDLHSVAKSNFINDFTRIIMEPRGLRYKIQFTSPTGTSCIESAVKLARKATGRQGVICFTNAFHGMTATSLSMTGNKHHRQSISVDGSIVRMPFEGYVAGSFNVADYMRCLFNDPSSGVDLPAAIVVETIQGEGGLNVASVEWLQSLRKLSSDFGIVLVIDDVQAGCGRSGTFFSFEYADIRPDMVCLSKSIGAFGLPMAVLLIDPQYDVWKPAEDNGTFRGNCLAFVAASAMIQRYWQDSGFENSLALKENIIRKFLLKILDAYPEYIIRHKGRGLMQGLEFSEPYLVCAIIKSCYSKGLIIESCGPLDQVIKLMPALTISLDVLDDGLCILRNSIVEVLETFKTEYEARALNV